MLTYLENGNMLVLHMSILGHYNYCLCVHVCVAQTKCSFVLIFICILLNGVLKMFILNTIKSKYNWQNTTSTAPRSPLDMMGMLASCVKQEFCLFMRFLCEGYYLNTPRSERQSGKYLLLSHVNSRPQVHKEYICLIGMQHCQSAYSPMSS